MEDIQVSFAILGSWLLEKISVTDIFSKRQLPKTVMYIPAVPLTPQNRKRILNLRKQPFYLEKAPLISQERVKQSLWV